MKVLKVDFEIPFWCSFSEYGTVNIRLTYPFPPPPTIFGLIQNALQKPSIHTIPKDKQKGIIAQYLIDYSKLDFAIIIREKGEKIDDYFNIHKGSRENESFEGNLDAELKEKINELGLNEKIDQLDLEEKEKTIIKRSLNKLNKKIFFENMRRIELNAKISKKDRRETENIINLIKELKAEDLITNIYKFWKTFNDIDAYNANKNWIRTQINRQKLITPKYTIYIRSSEVNGEYSLENILNHLKNPKRPLYLGESDDIVNINKLEIREVNDEMIMSPKVNSVIPEVYTNSQLVKIPIKLKNDIPDEKGHNLICSIPQGELEQELPCLNVSGENIVFL